MLLCAAAKHVIELGQGRHLIGKNVGPESPEPRLLLADLDDLQLTPRDQAETIHRLFYAPVEQ